MRSLSQKRAEFALSKVHEIIDNHDKLNNKKFKSFTAGVPTMILQNGFGQAFAFWASKAKNNENTSEGFVLQIIREWFDNENNPLNLKSNASKDFIDQLVKKDQIEFLQFQQEALLMLEWFKRFSNAFLSE